MAEKRPTPIMESLCEDNHSRAFMLLKNYVDSLDEEAHVKNRKELAQLVTEAKLNDAQFTVNRSDKDGYRYSFKLDKSFVESLKEENEEESPEEIKGEEKVMDDKELELIPDDEEFGSFEAEADKYDAGDYDYEEMVDCISFVTKDEENPIEENKVFNFDIYKNKDGDGYVAFGTDVPFAADDIEALKDEIRKFMKKSDFKVEEEDVVEDAEVPEEFAVEDDTDLSFDDISAKFDGDEVGDFQDEEEDHEEKEVEVDDDEEEEVSEALCEGEDFEDVWEPEEDEIVDTYDEEDIPVDEDELVGDDECECPEEIKKQVADLLRDEWEAAKGYSEAIDDIMAACDDEDCECECGEKVADLLTDIREEELVHVGELEKAMDMVDDHTEEKIEDGKAEAEEKTEDEVPVEAVEDIPEEEVKEESLKEEICPICGDDVDEPCEKCKAEMEKEEVEEALTEASFAKKLPLDDGDAKIYNNLSAEKKSKVKEIIKKLSNLFDLDIVSRVDKFADKMNEALDYSAIDNKYNGFDGEKKSKANKLLQALLDLFDTDIVKRVDKFADKNEALCEEAGAAELDAEKKSRAKSLIQKLTDLFDLDIVKRVDKFVDKNESLNEGSALQKLIAFKNSLGEVEESIEYVPNDEKFEGEKVEEGCQIKESSALAKLKAYVAKLGEDLTINNNNSPARVDNRQVSKQEPANLEEAEDKMKLKVTVGTEENRSYKQDELSEYQIRIVEWHKDEGYCVAVGTEENFRKYAEDFDDDLVQSQLDGTYEEPYQGDDVEVKSLPGAEYEVWATFEPNRYSDDLVHIWDTSANAPKYERAYDSIEDAIKAAKQFVNDFDMDSDRFPRFNYLKRKPVFKGVNIWEGNAYPIARVNPDGSVTYFGKNRQTNEGFGLLGVGDVNVNLDASGQNNAVGVGGGKGSNEGLIPDLGNLAPNVGQNIPNLSIPGLTEDKGNALAKLKAYAKSLGEGCNKELHEEEEITNGDDFWAEMERVVDEPEEVEDDLTNDDEEVVYGERF